MNTPTEKKIVAAQKARAEAAESFKKKREDVTALLNSSKAEITKVLPENIKSDRFITLILNYLTKNPELFDCTKHSILGTVILLAELGLIPDDVIGEAYMRAETNYRKRVKECTFIVGYKGLIALAMRAGIVSYVETATVYGANQDDGDYFDYDLGLNKKLEHKPVGLEDQARITHFYSIAKMKDGDKIFKVITRKVAEDTRDENQSFKNGDPKTVLIWTKKFDEMGMKTAIRKLFKNIPVSGSLARALAVDEAADFGKQNIAASYVDIMPQFAGDIAEEILNEAEQEEVEKEIAKKKVKEGKNKTKADNVATGAMNMINQRETAAKTRRNHNARN